MDCEGDSLLPLHTDALLVAIVSVVFPLVHYLHAQHLHFTRIRAMLLGPETSRIASYAGAALLGLLVHAYAAPFPLTLCGHGRASHAPRIRRRRPLPRLSASPLRRVRRPHHIHRPAPGQAPQRNLCEELALPTFNFKLPL
ncbi:hypothetical protein K438DRAFT_1967400 [Mycena galopus ATCC 62051]|nr:hypothetical protein K438DRAFT_1967400 [Mycena galopus ATCC 62051]